MTFVDIQETINRMSYQKFEKMVTECAVNNGLNPKTEFRKASQVDLQLRLQNLGINESCPQCGESNKYKIVKNVTRNKIQRYKCKSCNLQFTAFTDTILEKTRYHWTVWIKMLQMTLTHTPLDDIQHILETDYGCHGIDIKTIWAWRLKLCYALSQLPTPTLTGVIQIDETHVYESQKGQRKLINFASKHSPRLARKGHKPSKYGPMGAEFTTIVAAIDDRGYSISKAISYGKFDIDVFDQEFSQHLNYPAYICTDNNLTYTKYCENNALNHYIRPSNYVKTLE